MKRAPAVLAAVLLATAAASAQPFPDDPGNGVKLGIQELNTSGQVGEITLFDGGPNARLTVRVDGANGHPEAVRIYRGQACETGNPAAGRPAFVLSNLNPVGMSRTQVHVTVDRLLSGNYNAVVLSSAAPGARPVACGHLYR